MNRAMQKLCYFINSDWYFLLHWKERAIAAIDSGYEVHLICNVTDQKNKEKLEALGLTVHDSKMSEQSTNPLVFVKDIYSAIRIIAKINPSIMHCITIKACLIGGVFAKIKNIKLVLSFVGLGRVFSSDNMKYLIIRRLVASLYRWIAKREGVFFVFEHHVDRDVIARLTGVELSKTAIINGAGVDTQYYLYKEEPENKIPVVLFASRLIWSKGLQDLIEVKKTLESEGCYFVLKVAGIVTKDDPDAMPDEMISKWHNEGYIDWMGQSDNVKLLIEDANIVALPSTYAEGVPRILIEAASVGRASIAYDTGGCSSIILNNKTGYIVARKDINDLTKKVKMLLENPALRQRFGHCAREGVVKGFCSSSVIQLTLKIYSSL
ncbi:glycosyltransferase family 4 protein [Pantoea sp. A4]|uniref:glycosyltransferase family 4 protein n=1 Tax=Pantoea sp. A4 TaxID=1225184 RepID=UPI000A61C2FA|nr:glycosyltransferase family 4 protein [Pantoea sp. A4]